MKKIVADFFQGLLPSLCTKRPESTARTAASGRILGEIFAFLEKSSKNWSKSECWPTIGPPDRPAPAITYYKYLRGFFIHQFFSISPNLQNDLRVPPGLPLPVVWCIILKKFQGVVFVDSLESRVPYASRTAKQTSILRIYGTRADFRCCLLYYESSLRSLENPYTNFTVVRLV